MKIEFKDKEWGLEWGLGCFQLYAEEVAGVNRVDEVYVHVLDSVLNQYKLYYCAMLNWYKIQDETNELPFNFREFAMFLDKQPEEFHNKIMEDFRNSTFSGKSMEEHYRRLAEALEVVEDSGKKKASQATSDS